MHLNVLVSSIVFVSLYAGYARDKSVGTGLKFGFLIGVCLGVGNGYGTYSLMPIPHSITFCWFLARVVEMTAGGIVVGLIMSRRSVPATEWSYYEENQTANSPSS